MCGHSQTETEHVTRAPTQVISKANVTDSPLTMYCQTADLDQTADDTPPGKPHSPQVQAKATKKVEPKESPLGDFLHADHGNSTGGSCSRDWTSPTGDCHAAKGSPARGDS